MTATLAAPHSYDPIAGMRSHLGRAVSLIALLTVGLGGAATFVPMRGAVVAQGRIGVESRVKTVAHPTGGTVAQIFVRNGQHVRKGDILVRLDDRVSTSNATLSALSVDQLMAQKARLEAEQNDLPAIAFPAALTSRHDQAAMDAMADERRMFILRHNELDGIAAQTAARLRQYQDQITGYQAQIAALRQQDRLIQPERQGLKSLYERKLVTISRLNEMERTAADIGGNIGALTAQIAQTRGQMAEARAQLIQVEQTHRSEAGTQLAQVNEQLNMQRGRAVSTADERDRTVIRAPYSGVVEQFALTTVGDVVRPAEPILQIVPDNDALIVESIIAPDDIDQVAAGQTARIAFTGLNRGTTPELAGRVLYVAADQSTDHDGRSFYAARIAIDRAALATMGNVRLRPGMPAQIFVTTGDRSMLSYITKPLRDQFARSFLDGD